MCNKCCHFSCSEKLVDYECPNCTRYIELCYGIGTCECSGMYGTDIFCTECNWSISIHNKEEYINSVKDVIDDKINELHSILENIDNSISLKHLIKKIKKSINSYIDK